MTAQNVIDEFRTSTYYPECSSAMAATLFARAYKRVCSDLRLRQTEVFIPMVADQRTYAISAEVLRIWECQYDTSADATAALIPTTGQILFQIDNNYKQATGTPTHFYYEDTASGNTSVPKLCFYPVPLTSASGTYPRVRAIGSLHQALSTGDDIPSGLFDGDVFLYDMAYRYSIKEDAKMTDRWRQLYQEMMQKADQQVNGKPDGTQVYDFSFALKNPSRRNL
jgi:hypothetical protein